MSPHIIQDAEEAADGRRTAPAATRNAAPLIKALRARLPEKGRVLELASGTGQHAAAFSAAFPDLTWVPSDPDPMQRESIGAWRRASGQANFADPLALDVTARWPVPAGYAQAILTVNLLHLIPASALAPVFTQAREAAASEGRLCIYGPFLRADGYASAGDARFDAALRARDPAIGYKSLAEVTEAAIQAHWRPAHTDEMPANNLLLTFDAV